MKKTTDNLSLDAARSLEKLVNDISTQRIPFQQSHEEWQSILDESFDQLCQVLFPEDHES